MKAEVFYFSNFEKNIGVQALTNLLLKNFLKGFLLFFLFFEKIFFQDQICKRLYPNIFLTFEK